MKAELILPFLLALTDARAVRSRRGVVHTNLYEREVPQEHSHQQFLNTVKTMLDMNNPNQIADPVFALLGNAAAQKGQGKITDTDCLQLATADQAFTNAKAAGNVQGMTAALVYRALERNTAKVGQASVNCTSVQAVNPEIAAISQHQDAAAPNAQANNRAVELALAQQIASVGGDPTVAMMSGTFAPGQTNDPTAKGNSCDDANDQVGCIFTQNLLKAATTADELKQAAAGVAASNSTGSASASGSTAAGAAASTGSASSAGSSSSTGSSSSNSSSSAGSSASSGNGNAAAASGNVNLGSCQSAAVKFAAGLDGRTEMAFAPVDTTDFNHGSADGIGVITSFICQQLTDKCKAPAATATQCQTAAQAASKQTGQAAADAFNQGLGQTA